ncbi:MAG: alkyl hydroperoxide reductase/Thiol specific antioxidant/Mal allergen [Dehalococcoidia bacterium]|nr:alkyl hydroperoxide reductase/Thiol specific antioxidant/Mal allergen [Dehalococcoidia bacterium]
MSVLVNKPAPDFQAAAVMGDNNIKENFRLSDYRGKCVVLFFYPLDFTFVCPSEIIAFDHRLEQFRKHGAEVIGVSVDSQYTHLAWKNTPVERGGIGQVRYPLVSDLTKSIARSYDVLVDEAVALRATFIMVKQGMVQHQLVNNLPL